MILVGFPVSCPRNASTASGYAYAACFTIISKSTVGSPHGAGGGILPASIPSISLLISASTLVEISVATV